MLAIHFFLMQVVHGICDFLGVNCLCTSGDDAANSWGREYFGLRLNVNQALKAVRLELLLLHLDILTLLINVSFLTQLERRNFRSSERAKVLVGEN